MAGPKYISLIGRTDTWVFIICRASAFLRCASTSQMFRRVADEQGVGAIINLQEDTDMAFFDLDVEPIRERCMQRGDVAHTRYPIRDFDPFDLRMKLAGAVQVVVDQAKKLRGSGKKVYIHCTAGAHTCLCSRAAFGAVAEALRSQDEDCGNGPKLRIWKILLL